MMYPAKLGDAVAVNRTATANRTRLIENLRVRAGKPAT
jgi:hypothetical protein